MVFMCRAYPNFVGNLFVIVVGIQITYCAYSENPKADFLMMWFTKFLDIMSSLIPVTIPDYTLENLSKLNPEKFYIENVRSLLNVSHDKANRICEMAVRQGFFKKGIEIICPDGVVAESVDEGNPLPTTVFCYYWDDGDYKEVEINVDGLERNTYYRLNKKAENENKNKTKGNPGIRTSTVRDFAGSTKK